MMIFFTSDEHYGHHNIIKYCRRPYQWWDEMDEALIENHNKIVTDKDEVWHLGDFTLGTDYAKYLSRLKGKRHYLILGNHDREKVAKECFNEVYNVHMLNVNGLGIWLSHYAHSVWPRQSRGAIHLFGHSHGTYPSNPLKEKRMDVGVDCTGYYPISLEKVLKLMGTK